MSKNEEKIIQTYKEIIEKEFIEGKAKGLPPARMSVAVKTIKDFKKIIQDQALIAEFIFFSVECISSFIYEFSPDDEGYYEEPVFMFEEALKILKKNKLEQEYASRAHDIVKMATDSFGFQDTLQDAYESIYGEFKE